MNKLVTTSIFTVVAAIVISGCAQGDRESVCVCSEDYGADFDDCNRVLKAKAKGDCGTVKEVICQDPTDRNTCHKMDVKINCDGVDSKDCKEAIKELADCVEFTGCLDRNCWDEWKDLDGRCRVRAWQYCVGFELGQTNLPADSAVNPAHTCAQGAFYDIEGAL